MNDIWYRCPYRQLQLPTHSLNEYVLPLQTLPVKAFAMCTATPTIRVFSFALIMFTSINHEKAMHQQKDI